MRRKISFFLFSVLFLIISYLFAYRVLNPQLAWLAFPIALLFLKWIDLAFIQGIIVLKNLSKERIDLNLTAAGLSFKKNSYKRSLYLKAAMLLIIIFTIFSYSLWNDIENTYQFISHNIKTSRPILKIEFPSYSGQAPKFYDLSEDNNEISIDTSSYLEISIDNLKKDNNWQVLFIEDKKIYPEKNVTFSIQLGSWSSSANSLYSLFDDKNELVEKKVKDNVIKNIKIVISNKEKKYQANLVINPTIRPVVSIESANIDSIDTKQNVGKLNFNVDVKSSVPLTLIELSVRTQSGYHFDKALAEFANASEFSFKSDSAELVTLGIPFLPEDALYVKAVAKTVLTGVVGESKELYFPIKTPIQVRAEIIKKLEESKKLMMKMNKVNSEQKFKIIPLLSNAAQLASNLSQSGIVRRNIIESINLVENMSLKNDSQFNRALAKIQTTINILKRQQNASQSTNFIARLQNLKNKIHTLNTEEKDYSESASEAHELSEMAADLNKQLKEMNKNETYPLTKNEKTMIQSLLKNDMTSQKIYETAKNLKQSKIIEAQQEIQNAFDEGNNHLGFAMQIMQQARQRAMQDAKLKLQKADSSLENSKYFPTKNEVLNELMKVKESLEKTPLLGGEFNESLEDAKGATKKSYNFGMNDQSFERLTSTQKAQEAVEKAILSLQDEDESDKELQKEQDARAFRSTMDVLAAQGVLDSSWRKKILEEISRLKGQGESSDSPMIRYLESRLR